MSLNLRKIYRTIFYFNSTESNSDTWIWFWYKQTWWESQKVCYTHHFNNDQGPDSQTLLIPSFEIHIDMVYGHTENELVGVTWSCYSDLLRHGITYVMCYILC